MFPIAWHTRSSISLWRGPPDQQIDLLIVVDQMLTGFDSKWINTLYLDKILVYEKLIQAFSHQPPFWARETLWHDSLLPETLYNASEYRRSVQTVFW